MSIGPNLTLYRQQYDMQLSNAVKMLPSVVEMLSRSYEICGTTENTTSFFDALATKHYDVDINIYNRKTKYAMAKDLLFLTNASDHRMKVIFTPSNIFDMDANFDKNLINYSILNENIVQDNPNYILKYFQKVGLLLCTNVSSGIQTVVYLETPSIVVPTNYAIIDDHSGDKPKRMCFMTILVKYNLTNKIERLKFRQDNGRGPIVDAEINTILSMVAYNNVQVLENYYGLTKIDSKLTDVMANTSMQIPNYEIVLHSPINYTQIRQDLPITEPLVKLTLNLSQISYNTYEHISTPEWYVILMGIAMVYKANTVFLIQRFLSDLPGDDRIPFDEMTSADTFKIIHFNKLPCTVDINNSIIVELYGNYLYVHATVTDNFIVNYPITQPQQDNIIEVCYSKNANAVTIYRQVNPYYHTINDSYMFFEQPTWIIDKHVTPEREIPFRHYKCLANVNIILDFFKRYSPTITTEIKISSKLAIYCVTLSSLSQPTHIQSLITYTAISDMRKIFEIFNVWVICSMDGKVYDIRPYEDYIAVECIKLRIGNMAMSTLLELLTLHRLDSIKSTEQVV